MRVGQRLFLTVLPAALGCVTAVGLAYWGQYGHQVPVPVLLVALTLAVVSFAVAWWNARYVTRRIERVARAGGTGEGAQRDEIDTIERVVDVLSEAAATAEATRATAAETAAAQLAEYVAMLASATTAATARLDELRMPLHILLENHFGELNENQEEMLGAARGAADAVDEELGRLRRLVELDRGSVLARRESLRLTDLLPPMLRAAESRAQHGGDDRPRCTLELAPALPRVAADFTLLRETMELVLDDVLARAAPHATVHVHAAADESEGIGNVIVDVAVDGVHSMPPSSRLALARRLAEVQGGSIAAGARSVRLVLPRSVGERSA